jgi:diketogulonate reductase-like aldo/keto reductase
MITVGMLVGTTTEEKIRNLAAFLETELTDEEYDEVVALEPSSKLAIVPQEEINDALHQINDFACAA